MKSKKPAAKKAATKKPATKSRAVAETIRPVSMTAAERKRMQEEEARWRAQDDLRILRSSQEIMSDPARIKRAQALADEEIRALKSVKSKK
jgi:succinate dehydrogenase/fumarate reductase flavoprotein subunit